MSSLKPHNDHAGYVAELRRGPLLPDGKRGWVTIYDTKQTGALVELADSGFDPEGARWVAVCQSHGTLVNHASQRAARSTMKSGSLDFCDHCRALEEEE